VRKNIKEATGDGVVVLDGAMGTALMKRGLASGAPGEAWNLENPDAVREVHSIYIAAGSDAVQTNTFGGTRFRLEHHGLADRIGEINAAAVRIAREAAGDEIWVAGNIGPSGLLIAPVGDAEPDVLEQGYAEQARHLAEAGADYLSIETMLDLKEARIALKAAKSVAPDLPVSVCMIFEKKKRGFFSPMGDKPAESLRTLAEEGADMAGANCSMGSREMLEMLEGMELDLPVPLVMKPNAGLPETRGTEVVYRQEPADFASDILAMVRLGARLVGGCCGSDDRFIAAIREGLADL
jgi:5-methyltetrahydrofolate--homocysteine methyltransferase